MGVLQLIERFEETLPRNQLVPRPVSDRSPLAVVTGYLDIALQLWDEDRVQAKSRVEVAAALLRDQAAEWSHGPQPAGTPDHCGLAPWQARKVREFIDASLDSRIRLGDCASRARLSNSHFSHVFKATFGTTVCHYIRCRRVERAKQLMLSSDESLSQIALACGFADQPHYCRVFRNVVGVSPNTWRRNNMR